MKKGKEWGSDNATESRLEAGAVKEACLPTVDCDVGPVQRSECLLSLLICPLHPLSAHYLVLFDRTWEADMDC